MACTSALLVLATGCLSPPPPPPPPSPVEQQPPPAPTTPTAVRYLLYGDSLSWQSAPNLAQHGTVGDEYAIGDAPCDRVAGLPLDTIGWVPQEVLVQFSGNTPACVGTDRTGSYQQTLTTIVQTWRARGVPVRMVISPINQSGDRAWAQAVEVSVAGATGIPVTDAGQAVLDNGAFTFFLPCIPTDTTCGNEQPGLARVRSTDGLHFGTDGARRFADAEA
jgi:hypothetical protein